MTSDEAEPDPYAGGRSSKGCARLGIGLLVLGCAAQVGFASARLCEVLAADPDDDGHVRGFATLGLSVFAPFAVINGIAAAIGLRSRALASVPRWIGAAAWTVASLAIALPVALCAWL